MRAIRINILLSGLLICGIQTIHAQELIPFPFISEEKNKLLDENDTVKIYAVRHDTSLAVSINEDMMYARIVSRRNTKRVLAEGYIAEEGETYIQHGRWTAYYTPGKPRIKGNYIKGMPAGAWEEYHGNGRLKDSYHYGIFSDKDGTYTCMTGEYRAYTPAGKLQITGYYMAERTRTSDTLVVEDPVTGDSVHKKIYRSVLTAHKTGTWTWYDEEGIIEKTQEY